LLRRLQEHHAQPARQLAFNTMDADKGNLFATVAHNQVRCGVLREVPHAVFGLCACVERAHLHADPRRARRPSMTTSTSAATWPLWSSS
jgi:hypothetical protein